jgi:D-sedoheptulose 7-phosphate isomerase
VSADSVRESLGRSIAALEALRADPEVAAQIARLAATISASLAAGGKVWLFGNGGSAADAQHIAAEFVGRFARDRAALAAEALTTNSSVVTAIANDFGFAEIFGRQLEAHGRPGDVAIGISTSGRSENVVIGLRTAGRLGLHTAALTGGDGGAVAHAASECIVVPAVETPRIQECHAVIGHVLCELVEAGLA